jgi:hypothetical protein
MNASSIGLLTITDRKNFALTEPRGGEIRSDINFAE